MTSAVTICSAALGLLGDSPISSLTQADKRSQLCGALYPQIRDRLLRRMQPTFARTRVVLASLSLAPPGTTWSTQFQLPSDCLRLMQVGEEGFRESYRLEGKRILANATSLLIVYVKLADEQTWDSQFIDLVTTAMAKALAYPITKSPPMRDAMAAEYERMRKECGGVEGQESEPDDLPDSTILTARYN